MPIFTTALAQITTLAMLGICVLAVLVGRWPERATALVLAIDWIGSAVGQDRRPTHHGQPVELALDLVLTGFLLVLTASCRRVWLLWMSACAVLLVFTHLAVLIDVRLNQWSYLTAYYIWSVGLLLSFGAGVLLEGRRPVRWLFRVA